MKRDKTTLRQRASAKEESVGEILKLTPCEEKQKREGNSVE